eukprot:1985852-Alexandrium_andersonii.AAC.1
MGDPPRRQGRTPSLEAQWGPLRAATQRVLPYGRRCLHSNLGHQSLCWSSLARSTRLVGRRL